MSSNNLQDLYGNIYQGRLGNLTAQQELILKQVWVNMLWKLGYDNLKLPSNLKVDSNDTSIDLKENSEDSSSSSSSTAGIKWGFGKKKSSTPTGSSIGSNAEFKLHDSLKPVSTEVLQSVFWSFLRTDYPDNLILRFIRARKWNLSHSLGMMFETINWRRTYDSDPDELILKGEVGMLTDPEDIESGLVDYNLKTLKSIVIGRDLKGRPIVLCRPKLHHAKEQTEKAMEKYAILVIETTRLFLRERDSIDQALIIFDLSDFKTSNMDYAPVKFLIKCFEAHYPECLGKLLIHKAPWIFSPIWNIIKNWLDPVVADKISFSKNTKDLEKFINRNQIPQYLGGDSTYDLDNYPADQVLATKLIDDKATLTKLKQERHDLIQQFLKKTCEWIENEDPSKRDLFTEERLKLSALLSKNYKDMDPYVRGKGMYDVLGQLQLE